MKPSRLILCPGAANRKFATEPAHETSRGTYGAPRVHAEQADLPGVKLWYTDTGGHGIPIILLHANTGTSVVWAKQKVLSQIFG